jgi:hypothetical protein
VSEVTGLRATPAGLQGLANSACDGDTRQLGERVNTFFHSISSNFSPLQESDFDHGPHVIPDKYIISVEQVESRLQKLNPRKGMGPDGIPTWILREFAPLLSRPICAIYNSSVRESFLPPVWKQRALVIPVPKCNPPRSIEKDLRPISLTPILAKELEFFVCKWIMDLACDKLDRCQDGALKNSSTVHALVEVMHEWSTATDARGVAVRALLLDYRKAFDLIDHHVLMDKLQSLGLPQFILSWIAAFLYDRHQRVKLGEHMAEWLPVNGGVPQGTRVGPLVFLFMVNDLLEGSNRSKFVDDTLSWEVCQQPLAENSRFQLVADNVTTWTDINHMQLNVTKTKEMTIDFSRGGTDPPSIVMNGQALEKVDSAKVLGVILSDDLSWDKHVDHIVSKASQRIYFLCLLRRVGASVEDMLTLFKSSVRSGLEYACAVWHTSLTQQQSEKIESVQKRAFRIIHPLVSYGQALTLSGLVTLHARRENLARNFFRSMLSPDHRLHHLLPAQRDIPYSLRGGRRYPQPALRTNRARNSFINYGLRHWQ